MQNGGPKWCTAMFLFCALADVLGSPSVPQLLSPSIFPEEGTFCFWRRRAITAGSTSPPHPCCSRWRNLLESHIYPCNELAKMLCPKGRVSRVVLSVLIQQRWEVPAHPSPEASGLPWPQGGERWGHSEHAARYFCFLVLLGGFRCTRGWGSLRRVGYF